MLVGDILYFVSFIKCLWQVLDSPPSAQTDAISVKNAWMEKTTNKCAPSDYVHQIDIPLFSHLLVVFSIQAFLTEILSTQNGISLYWLRGDCPRLFISTWYVPIGLGPGFPRAGEPERNYNSHYSNGVPAMFTS